MKTTIYTEGKNGNGKGDGVNYLIFKEYSCRHIKMTVMSVADPKTLQF